jgi:hypothetical protein
MNQKNVRTWCDFFSTIQSANKGIQANGLQQSLIRIVKRIDHLDRLRKVTIIIGLSIILMMLLYPPFHVIYSPGIEIHKGYAFVLNSPPMFRDRVGTVNMNLLSLQIGTVVILLGVVQLLFKIQRK